MRNLSLSTIVLRRVRDKNDLDRENPALLFKDEKLTEKFICGEEDRYPEKSYYS